jgi:hypothetical protein
MITGAARGQGRAHALRLAEQAGARTLARHADIRVLAEVDEAVAAGMAEFGRLDVVVANAGICAWGRLWEITPEQWEAVLDVNLTGTWHTLRAAIPAMIDAGHGGSIIVVSSVAGLKPLPGQAHYSASKHGVVGLAGSAAIELGPFGIRVNSIHPWGVDTVMAADAEMNDLVGAERHYRGSFGQVLREPALAAPRDIADAVLWLASDESRTVTGIALPVDLGATTV